MSFRDGLFLFSQAAQPSFTKCWSRSRLFLALPADQSPRAKEPDVSHVTWFGTSRIEKVMPYDSPISSYILALARHIYIQSQNRETQNPWRENPSGGFTKGFHAKKNQLLKARIQNSTQELRNCHGTDIWESGFFQRTVV